jgi:xanthine dehydrogenase FAD-binding subunit
MNYISPKSINEAIELNNKHNSETAIIAGCTDTIVKKNFFDNKELIIDITSINELKKIEDKRDNIRIGACVTFAELKDSELIKKNSKALSQAASVFGSVQIRNRGTIGGNIINASPAADSIPSLMVSNAQLILLSEKGEETVSIRNFFSGPGKTILKSNQILGYIEIEKDKPESITFYRKIGTRKALSIAKASIAFKADKTNNVLRNVNIAFGSVGPTVIFSKSTSKELEGKSLNIETIKNTALEAYKEVTPIDDIRSSQEYRKLVVKNALIEELHRFI